MTGRQYFIPLIIFSFHLSCIVSRAYHVTHLKLSFLAVYKHRCILLCFSASVQSAESANWIATFTYLSLLLSALSLFDFRYSFAINTRFFISAYQCPISFCFYRFHSFTLSGYQDISGIRTFFSVTSAFVFPLVWHHISLASSCGRVMLCSIQRYMITLAHVLVV